MSEELHLAKHWEINNKEKNTIKCTLCPRYCIIPLDQQGFCGVRKNIEGKLYTLVYSNPVSTNIDPIEKKPLFHFLPGTTTFSFGTVGCNLACKFCQNWEIARAKPSDFNAHIVEPEEIVKAALDANCKSISYTYTEPTIFFEFVLETAKLAKKNGLKNIMVSNGYITKEAAEELYPFIDAINIDLKGFTEEFYKKTTGATLEPVLETLKLAKKMGLWLEITNLLLHDHNDDMEKIKQMCEWIKDNLGEDIPLHFSRSFPMHKMMDLVPTPEETLIKAKDTAEKVGLKYVYIGNVLLAGAEDTKCPECKRTMVKRHIHEIMENKIVSDACNCGNRIAGIWK